MVTVRQLAKLAGVSTATVSLSLRNDPRISAGTRQRIQELAAQHQYRNNRITHMAGRGEAVPVGYLISAITSVFGMQALDGIIETPTRNSYSILPIQVLSNPLVTQQAIHDFVQQRVAGVLIFPGQMAPVTSASVLEMWSQGIYPIALNYTLSEIPIDSVFTDDDAAGEIAVEYLASLGHCRIGYLGQVTHGNAVRRAQGIRAALERRGLSTDYLLHRLESHKLDIWDRALATFLAMPHPPTAIIAQTAGITARLMQRATRIGLRVPQDISLLAGSESTITEYNNPAITAIAEHPKEFGRQAILLLQQRLQDEAPPSAIKPALIKVAPTLIVRESCTHPRARG
jgi:DNA-binding LacI/PurR family transcriptional regulator